MGVILDQSFFQHPDVEYVARRLLGKKLCFKTKAGFCSGRIVETEAYAGPWDKASHAYGNKRTPRTEVMFHPGGCAYVYFCYGMHHMFNVVTGPENTPHAVLIRALEPLEGIDLMKARRKNDTITALTNGPAKLCQALGIDRALNGQSLISGQLYIEEDGHHPCESEVVAVPRIGIDYAQEHAQLPMRFYISGSMYVSKR